MKLKDILSAVGCHTDWIRFDANWNLDDSGQVNITLPTNITIDTEVNVHYQWFWHCNPNINTTEICYAIKSHDYTTFTKWFEALKSELPYIYLPCDAEIWVDNVCVGNVCVAFNEETFRLITSQDHECG